MEEIRVRKFNPKVKSWDLEVLPYDAKTLAVMKETATANGELALGSYSAPSGKFAIITGIKMIAESADTWFSFGGDYQDVHYLPAKGVDMITGSSDDPVTVLDSGESIVPTVSNAVSGITYAVVLYGAERDKKPLR